MGWKSYDFWLLLADSISVTICNGLMANIFSCNVLEIRIYVSRGKYFALSCGFWCHLKQAIAYMIEKDEQHKFVCKLDY